MTPTATTKDMVVWLSIRRNRIELAKTSRDSPASLAEPNMVHGTVQAIEYQGSYVKVPVQPSGDEDVIAYLSDRAFFPIQVNMGDGVVAGWWVEDVHQLHAQREQMDDREIGERPYARELDESPR